VATSYNNIGSIWDSKGEYDKALELYQQCLDIQLMTLGAEHPDVAISYNNIGVVWDNKGEYDKALEFYQQCLDIRLRTLGAEHPDVANSYNNIGVVWDNKGEYDKALEFYQQCLDIRLKTLGARHPSAATSYFTIGTCYKESQLYNQAIDNYVKGFVIDSKGGFPFRIAQCFEALLDLNAAFDYYIQSAEIRKNDREVGIAHEATQESITNALRLAKQLLREDELPRWILESC
jgi:tetratricopeptide (TPR) repeat protein